MRKLMWFAIGFAAACGLWVYGLPAKYLKAVFLLTAAAACLIGVAAGRKQALRPAALIALGLLLGTGWYGFYFSHHLAAPMSLYGKTQTVTIHTADYAYETGYGSCVDGLIELDGKTYQIRAYLKQKTLLEPGHEITGPFRFQVTAGEREMTYHASKGIFLLAYQTDDVRIQTAAKPAWQDRVSRLRQTLRTRLRRCLPEDAYPFAQALLLGDTSEIDYETDTALKVSGIRHVVAVSGLHVSILFTLLGAVTFRKRFLMSQVGIVLLIGFAALAAFTPSVVRACIMSGLMLLALLAGREYDGATALSFAAVVMLAGNPMVIASASFQLSVASVAGILLFSDPVKTWILSLFPDPAGKKEKRRGLALVANSVAISLSAMALTTPLCAYYFGMVSLVGVITNLLALWVVSGIFYGILAVCLLSAFWMGAGKLLGALVAWPIRYVLAIAKGMAAFPLAAVYTENRLIVFWLIFVYVLLGLFLVSKNRKPWQLICCGVLGLCVCLLPAWMAPSETRITVLDVGQGQCILLEDGGRTYMVDCGGDSDTRTADIAASALLSRGIVHLDGLILTHLDRDHAGAVENLLSRIAVDVLILPPVYSDLDTTGAERVLYARSDLLLAGKESKLTVFASNYPGTDNEKSLCVLFDTEKCDILITGDRDGFGERLLLRNAQIPQVDVLIAGHHGSKHSTCEELLVAASPEIVCISAGRDNGYGHPAPELLERLKAFGCAVYRTDQNGTITIRR